MKNIDRIEELTKEIEEKDIMLQRIDNNINYSINAIDDMFWQKDLKNRFVRVNKSICTNLLLSKEEDIIGKTLIDIEQELTNKGIIYNVGTITEKSDLTVIDNKKTCKFLEDFVIDGKKMYLLVIKSPLFDLEGNLIGTVGTGRNITEDVETHKKMIDLFNDKNFEELSKVFKEYVSKYYFSENEDSRLIEIIK